MLSPAPSKAITLAMELSRYASFILDDELREKAIAVVIAVFDYEEVYKRRIKI